MNVYEKAIEAIKDRGWNDGDLVAGSHESYQEGSVCLLGALGIGLGAEVIQNDSWTDEDNEVFVSYDIVKDGKYGFEVVRNTPEVIAVAGLINEQYPEEFMDFPSDSIHTCYSFNDSHSQDEVVAILEKAAVREPDASS